MPSVKEKIKQIVYEQPDDSSFDEILRELAFLLEIGDSGLSRLGVL